MMRNNTAWLICLLLFCSSAPLLANSTQHEEISKDLFEFHLYYIRVYAEQAEKQRRFNVNPPLPPDLEYIRYGVYDETGEHIRPWEDFPSEFSFSSLEDYLAFNYYLSELPDAQGKFDGGYYGVQKIIRANPDYEIQMRLYLAYRAKQGICDEMTPLLFRADISIVASHVDYLGSVVMRYEAIELDSGYVPQRGKTLCSLHSASRYHANVSAFQRHFQPDGVHGTSLCRSYVEPFDSSLEESPDTYRSSRIGQ